MALRPLEEIPCVEQSGVWKHLGEQGRQHTSPRLSLQEKYGDVSRLCVCHRDGLKPLSGVIAGHLLAGTIGILFSLLERGPWVQKFSNVF